MPFSGLRKQFNKANQYLNETVGIAEATKLDDDYNEMERKIDLTNELINELIARIHEYLQPNPATRAKIAAIGAVSKVRGTNKSQVYPQIEELLSEVMLKYSKSLGDFSDLGKALCDAADAYRQMADVKYKLEDMVKHDFLDPIIHFQSNDLKDVNHHRSKLKGRRLDYDCKKRKQTRDEEMIQAEEKLEESKRLAEQAMFNVLSNDVEQISQLKSLIEAKIEFHQQTLQILDTLKNQLNFRIKESNEQNPQKHVPKPVITDRSPRTRSPTSGIINATSNINLNNGNSASIYSKEHNTFELNKKNDSNIEDSFKKSQCKALYDFEAQNPGELEFKEGQIIELISQIDENWYEGILNGKRGFFPISYVQVIHPL